MPHVAQSRQHRQRRTEHHQPRGRRDEIEAGGGARLRHVLTEEHHVRLEHPAARDAVRHDEPGGVLERHVPVRVHRGLCFRRSRRAGDARPAGVGGPQPRVELRPGRPHPAPQTDDAVQRPVQLGHGGGARRLVQPVHVLGDDGVDQPGPLEPRDRPVAGVRRRPGDVPPAQMRPRPVPLARRRRPGERLVRHRLPGPPRLPARPAVVRNAGFCRQPGSAQHRDVAGTQNRNQERERSRLTPFPNRLHQPRQRHSSYFALCGQVG